MSSYDSCRAKKECVKKTITGVFANIAKVSYNILGNSTYIDGSSDPFLQFNTIWWSVMGKSFQEQLLQLGLVGKEKVSKAKKQQHQKKKRSSKAGKKHAAVDENALLLQQAEEKKKARTRKLNLEREKKLQKRAEDAQVKQLVEQYRIEKDGKGLAYRFTVSNKIQRIFVEREVADKLSDGRLGIVGLADQFEVVPRAIIDKIQSISDRVFVTVNAPSAQKDSDPEDPYAGFEVPDDLMW